MTNNELEFQKTEVPPFNKELIAEYIRILEQKYMALDGDPFGFKARMVVRKEIESMRAFIEEHEMEKTFSSLSRAFGLGDHHKKPKAKPLEILEEDLNSSFRSKFANGDSRAELHSALDLI